MFIFSKPTRKRGTGSIYRMKGSAVYWIKYYHEGKPIRESTGETDADKAEAILSQKLSGVRDGSITPCRLVMSGRDVRKAKSPVVYVWKRGKEWLYIGACIRGISRILASHHVIDNLTPIQDGDSFLIYPQPDYEVALKREREMIERHRPRFNVTYLPERRKRQRPSFQAEPQGANPA